MKTEIGTEIVVYHESDAGLERVRNALAQAVRGDYQRTLATGFARWSGADLAGKAAKYSAHYAQSREAYLNHIVCESRGEILAQYARVKHGRKILVLTCSY